MSFLPSFTTWQFALAGALLATVPTILHLFFRRQRTTVKWAAMSLLREAMDERRRRVRLRDMLVLIARSLAVLLLGVALARPQVPPGTAFSWLASWLALLIAFAAAICGVVVWSHRRARRIAGTIAAVTLVGSLLGFQQSQRAAPATTTAHNGNSPVHLVVLLDNSLSMGYSPLEGPLIDQAKQRAAKLVESSPAGSRFSIVPLCATRRLVSRIPYPNPEPATAAIERIELADRGLAWEQIARELRAAREQLPQLPGQLVLFTDAQRQDWEQVGDVDLPDGETLHVVELGASNWENSWIQALRLEDEIVDPTWLATIRVRVGYRGPTDKVVPVTLSVDGRTVASGAANFSARPKEIQYRDVVLQSRFDFVAPRSGRPELVRLSATIGADLLPADNARHIVATVAQSIPVVVVDALGSADEDAARGIVGESLPLRWLLDPEEGQQPWADIRHVSTQQVDRQLLHDARFVALVGVDALSLDHDLLLEYVQQGGSLLVVAGERMQAADWNERAWRSGRGYLACPLLPGRLGRPPSDSDVSPFVIEAPQQLDASFQFSDQSAEQLSDLLTEAICFQALRVDQTTLRDWRPPTDAPSGMAAWWLHRRQGEPSAGDVDTEPRIHLRYRLPDSDPFIVSRRIGSGRSALITTGLSEQWSLLSRTNAVLLLDRWMRSMIRSTYRERNLPATDELQVPLPRAAADETVVLTRPEGREDLRVTNLRPNLPGVTINAPIARGFYQVGETENENEQRELFCLNGPAAESILDRLPPDHAARQSPALRFSQSADDVPFSAAQLADLRAWWFTALTVLLLLLLEMCFLTVNF